MKRVIETERLHLREFEETDADFLFSLLGDPEFFSFLAGKIKKSREECVETIARMRQMALDNDGLALWLIERKEDGAALGYCGYLIQEIDSEKLYEIAYGLHRDHRGQGYCAEAARGCKEWGITERKIERIISIVHIDNHPSARVAERNDMTPGPERELWGMPVRLFEWRSQR